MTTSLVRPRLFTVAEYLELGETESGYSELVEGRLILTPSPQVRHNRATFRAGMALEVQLPEEFEVVTDIDVDLELAAPHEPGFCRRPDLVIATRDARERVERDGGVLRASDLVLIMETMSPSSRRTDGIVKRAEYSDAGIGHYWILDVTAPVSLIACHLAGSFGYADDGEITGTFTTDAPLPLTLDLDALV